MDLAFDPNGLANVQILASVEFGVGRDDAGGELFALVPIEPEAQTALGVMATNTIAIAEGTEGGGGAYSPSEKYAPVEYVTVALDAPIAARFLPIHQAALPIDAGALREPSSIFCYFARFHATDGRRLTGVRRATQFKGILKARMIRLIDDSLRLVDDDVFKLDMDFDLLIDGATVHVIHPTGFELLGQLQGVILQAVPEHVAGLRVQLPFLDASTIEQYASTHPRAARYLASIQSQNAAAGVEQRALLELSRATGVRVDEAGGRLVVPPESVLGFLEVLDRRRYELELVPGSPESYRAPARSRVRGR